MNPFKVLKNPFKMGSKSSRTPKEDKQRLVENMEDDQFDYKVERPPARRTWSFGLARYNPIGYFMFLLRRRPLVIQENGNEVNENAEEELSFITDDCHIRNEENNMDQIEAEDFPRSWFDPKFERSVPDHKTQEEIEELLKTSVIHEPMSTVEKVRKWQEDTWAPKSTSKYELIRTRNLTTAERHIFSRVIFEATELRSSHEPLNAVQNYKVRGNTASLIFLHPTNEREIMNHIGSFRLNPFLDAKRDIESQDEEFLTRSHLCLIMNEQCMRKEECKSPYKSLTLKKAYVLGMVNGDRRDPNFRIPILRCRKPIFGIPYNIYFKRSMDVPEGSLEMIQLINEALRKFGVEIIDLRRRVEIVAGGYYKRIQRRKTACAAVETVKRALHSLTKIRNRGRFFVIYSFVLDECPFHFLQMIVRFKPGILLNPVDWKNDGSFRLDGQFGYPAKPTLENQLELADVVGPNTQDYLSFAEFQDLNVFLTCSEFL